jgi:replicative DNA helicase
LKDLAAMAPQIASRIQEKRFFARPHGKVWTCMLAQRYFRLWKAQKLEVNQTISKEGCVSKIDDLVCLVELVKSMLSKI